MQIATFIHLLINEMSEIVPWHVSRHLSACLSRWGFWRIFYDVVDPPKLSAEQMARQSAAQWASVLFRNYAQRPRRESLHDRDLMQQKSVWCAAAAPSGNYILRVFDQKISHEIERCEREKRTLRARWKKSEAPLVVRVCKLGALAQKSFECWSSHDHYS